MLKFLQKITKQIKLGEVAHISVYLYRYGGIFKEFLYKMTRFVMDKQDFYDMIKSCLYETRSFPLRKNSAR